MDAAQELDQRRGPFAELVEQIDQCRELLAQRRRLWIDWLAIDPLFAGLAMAFWQFGHTEAYVWASAYLTTNAA